MLTKNTFLFTGTALGSLFRERKGHILTPSHLGAAQCCTVYHWAASLDELGCLAKGHLSKLRVLRPCGHSDHVSAFHFHLLLPISFAQQFLAFYSLPLHRLYIYFSLCFSHLSLAVTHQECVSEDSEYVSAPSGQSQIFFFLLFELSFICDSFFLSLCFSSILPSHVNNWLYLNDVPLHYCFGFFLSLMILVMAQRCTAQYSQNPSVIEPLSFNFQIPEPA